MDGSTLGSETPAPAPAAPPPAPKGQRAPTWLTFLAGMLTAAALFGGVGFGIVSARDQSAGSGPGALDGTGTPVPNRPAPPAIVGRVVEVNLAQRQLLVRNRAGRFIIVTVTPNTVFRRRMERVQAEEARTELRRGVPVLVLGRQNGDQLQAQLITIGPPGALLPNVPNGPLRPGLRPGPNATPQPR